MMKLQASKASLYIHAEKHCCSLNRNIKVKKKLKKKKTTVRFEMQNKSCEKDVFLPPSSEYLFGWEPSLM